MAYYSLALGTPTTSPSSPTIHTPGPTFPSPLTALSPTRTPSSIGVEVAEVCKAQIISALAEIPVLLCLSPLSRRLGTGQHIEY